MTKELPPDKLSSIVTELLKAQPRSVEVTEYSSGIVHINLNGQTHITGVSPALATSGSVLNLSGVDVPQNYKVLSENRECGGFKIMYSAFTRMPEQPNAE